MDRYWRFCQNHAENHSETIRSLRRVRWAQVLVPLAIGLALLGTAVQSWVTVQRAATTVEMAQGRRLLRVVRRSLGPLLPPTREQLERVLDMHEDLGLRCVAMPDEDGGPPVIAGDCKLSPDEVRRVLDDPPLLGMLRIDRNVGMIGGRPRWRRGFGAAPPGATRWARMRSVLIVFEPLEAHALQRSVTRSLIVALAALLALIAAAIVLWRLSRRAERLQEAAERDRRFVTLGEMSAVLAHEIRNPLAALKGHAQLLLERLGDAGAPREKAARVVAEAQRLERLTEDLLSFVRSSQVSPVPVDPAAVLREAVRDVDPVQIDVDTAAAPTSWRLDPVRMHQALVNLLRNAVEASPAGAHAVASVAREGEALGFRVRDRGVGVPAGDADRIFEPFYTTRAQGTGLGLAVARRIVELHGGAVTAHTHPEGGAEFRVVIP
jgi:two-component system sensor histidine kinase HydH